MTLVPRRPYTVDPRLPAITKPWRKWLLNDEQTFLTDNQLSAWLADGRAGWERFHFYPLPFPVDLKERWEFPELVNHDSLRSVGPYLDVAAQRLDLQFQPHRIARTLAVNGARVQETSTVSGNTLLLIWEPTADLHTTLRFGLPYFAGHVEQIEDGLLIDLREQVFVCLRLAHVAGVAWTLGDDPVECQADLSLPAGASVVLALTCGYDRQQVLEQARLATEQPQQVLAAAENTWAEYFERVVPAFACSDERLEQFYYYQAYVTRANVYDIPYEPFTHLYTCPWKTGAVWQWSWNTPLDSVAERWLNDKQIGAGGILLEGDNGGAPNIGSYLHPLQKVTEMRHHDDQMQKMGAARSRLPDDFDLLPYTTLPHTTPNGLLGAWEYYLTSGDADFLRAALDIMLEAEGHFSRGELSSGLCTCSFVDEFDYSLRLRPYIRGFSKGDPEMMLKMDTPFVGVDYNCYLHALREVIIQAATLLGDQRVDADALRRRNARLAEAINAYLWDEEDGFYYDAHPQTLERSGIKCIAGFAPLYAGLASGAQAARLVEHLTNPDEFGTPYPCPSIAINTPEIDPSLITYGGDVLLTSGVWFTVQGLVRYGYRDLAADYVWRVLQMITAEGPSSSYSYHSLTGKYNQGKHTLAAQSVILTDLICKYIVGLKPDPHGAITVDPLALPRFGITRLEFGPFLYRDRWVTVRWREGEQYTLEIAPNTGIG